MKQGIRHCSFPVRNIELSNFNRNDKGNIYAIRSPWKYSENYTFCTNWHKSVFGSTATMHDTKRRVLHLYNKNKFMYAMLSFDKKRSDKQTLKEYVLIRIKCEQPEKGSKWEKHTRGSCKTKSCYIYDCWWLFLFYAVLLYKTKILLLYGVISIRCIHSHCCLCNVQKSR